MITTKGPDAPADSKSGPVWCCLRSQPKHEHIAAANLRQRIKDIEVFGPKLRIRRQTVRGPVWFVEALFPGYLFARFDPDGCMQSVNYTPGVLTVVKFGAITPTIPDQVIMDLRTQFEQSSLQEVEDSFHPGDEIAIGSGPFQGFSANVLRVLPAADRIQVLLEILGRITPVEISRDQILTRKSVSELLAARKSGCIP